MVGWRDAPGVVGRGGRDTGKRVGSGSRGSGERESCCMMGNGELRAGADVVMLIDREESHSGEGQGDSVAVGQSRDDAVGGLQRQRKSD